MVLNFLKSSYQSVKNVFFKTGSLLGEKLRNLFKAKLDPATLEDLEQIFYEADLGVKTSMELTKKIHELHQKNPDFKTEEFLAALKQEMVALLGNQNHEIREPIDGEGPIVLLIVGVNGTGKTTSIAKIAHFLKQQDKKILIAACDTFRAAAVDQLEIWAKRLGVDLVKGAPGSDPAAVAFDALSAGKARSCDYVMIDTAGRLQNKTHLMQELEKIQRTCKKVIPDSPHEILLVLDANLGQNAIDQAKKFHMSTPLTGLILTKLDGSAKGGMVIGTQRELNIPVKFIGIGEGLEDLKPFDAESFVNALLS